MEGVEKNMVSICVAYYNRSEYVKDCISSLINQDHENFEVIVVNDGSSDPNTLVELHHLKSNNLKIIDQGNTGFVGAMNNAISAAQGEYIAIMGAGDVCKQERIRKQADILDRRPEVGIVSCNFEDVAFGGPRDGERTPRNYPDNKITAQDFLFGANPIGHGEVMFRREIFDKVGGYRPFFKFSQDLDLWLRMIQYCDVEIVREILYERRLFAKDGVSTSVKKYFLQKYLAEFARQCFRDKQTIGYDYVDRYGMHAGLFKRPSKTLGKLASSFALMELKKKNFHKALEFLTISKCEKLTVKHVVVSVLLRLNSSSLGHRILNLFLNMYNKIKPIR